MAKLKKIDYLYGVGRRKTSQARVRVYHGKGENTVNGMPWNKYFEGEVNAKTLTKPFGATETSDKYYYSGRVTGGGKNGQLSALVLALSRALLKIAPEKNRVVLRKLKLLTRDSRVRQRRMVGMGGKSRRKRQSPKR
ncbi:MAG: ribosomal protein S9, small subunit ribosomal protein S9 [Microgenomates group bacterium GW2011_GWC1_39_7b]|uniref:30S ribosomal protein S9 n=3 Tax=Candidatus Woeseibacteriota TaxID=1752722 RepID=A0A0G0P1N3_9BACT|nr:MAG: 30S ribosomal protein S9 [Candidatus Woesebacteria bacterium GW2011_GWB1_39_10]KKR26995.1 MAG: ribosomal protein S9, small subunit ribosomal protein S9 [Microgenomates group bacterium GW2011_GWC1_39_7b]KKR74027.1 MAG: 30S ribosomal protein S9 [Candidatus Woesebacteria bacterium GW2011_GWA2_40_7]KKS90989.1 MAG: 30S ribosomal protein S9 [Candidatus Woesebacteria bacterium GW2011_GWA1_43_12]